MNDHPSDLDLVLRSRSGDARAFGMLVDRHQAVVYNLALRMVRDGQDAEDVAQRVFIKVYEKLDRFDPEYKFFSWIYRMTMNESINYVKERRHHVSLTTEHAATIVAADDESSRDVTDSVSLALMELDAEDRGIVIMKHIQGLSYEEIASILEIPQKTVKSRLYSARQRLKQIFIGQGELEHDG